MKELKFSNADVKKIVDTVTKKKAWQYKVSSIDGKIDWVLKNNPSKSKIDVYAGSKYIDDYKYDITEKDDVYATILNVLDYLTNILNKYNKRNPKAIKENEIIEAPLESSKLKIEAAASEVTEAMSKGMMRAYSKRVKEGDAHYKCKSCDTNIPKYRGRYPAKCPSCGESIKLMKEKDHEIGVVASYQRGSTVVVKLADPDEFYNAKINAYRPDNNSYAIEVLDGPDAGKVIQDITPGMIKKI